ncbi:MAG: endonuclease/exonuclease/phosphatase family protein [Planctomycetota bacterium]|jgi:endonuclease/exonuclease/phosphatase family metal-dependent hydrolase
MRVISYNLHKGTRRGQRDFLRSAIEAIAKREPDILLLQEVFHGAEDIVKQCHFVNEVIGHNHFFGPNVFYPRGCHGNATFSRLPIATGVNIDITESLLEKRGILHTELDAGDRAIAVLNTHFSLTGRQRRRQWFKLQHALPSDLGHPTLVCGDFNDWSGALDRRARHHGKLDNALWMLPKRRRRSFPSRRPVVAIDRIYFRGFKARQARVLDGEPWRRLSDHLPVEADLELMPLDQPSE